MKEGFHITMKMRSGFSLKELSKDSVTRSLVSMAKPNGSPVRGDLVPVHSLSSHRDSAGAGNSGWGSSKASPEQPGEGGFTHHFSGCSTWNAPLLSAQRCPAHGFPLLVKDQSHTLATPGCRLTAGSGIAGLALQVKAHGRL